jgi:hypothetical protein
LNAQDQPADPPRPPQIAEMDNPPKPPVALRVGVVGHRPNRLRAAQADMDRLGDVIKEILIAIQDEVKAFADENRDILDSGQVVLRAISPLAEGTDRLFATQAQALDWELCCPIPFIRSEYERDFLPSNALEEGSLELFQKLYESACCRFEIDGDSASRAEAYGICGQVVLSQSDLLVVVWDGDKTPRQGGTRATMDQAERAGMPVICIDAHAPHEWSWIPPKGADEPDIKRVVRGLLDVPKPKSESKAGEGKPPSLPPREDLMRFYDEHCPRWNYAVLWQAFRDVVTGSKPRLPELRVQPFEQSIADKWPVTDPFANRLRPYYAWPDKLSGLYADRYRSAFILVYLLAAAAVGLALAPVGLKITSLPGERVASFLELMAILATLFAVVHGQRRGWHERWIDYRLAAELVRHLRIVLPMGGQRPPPLVHAHHLTYRPPSATWMDWYVRAVTRWVGLPNVVLDKAYLRECLESIEALIKNQRDFHNTSMRRSHTIEHRLHVGVLVMLGLTVASCTLSILHVPFPGQLLTFFCGFLPALGAALVGINNQGEFRRVAKRSEAMNDHLALLLGKSTELKSGMETAPADKLYKRVKGLAEEVASVLVQEVLDWRVVFLDRPLDYEP